jgi:hypothetical protein
MYKPSGRHARFSLFCIVLLMLLGKPAAARAAARQDGDAFDVFLNANMNKNRPGLFFVDARTGLSSIVITDGTQHTLLNRGVLFQEQATGIAKIAYADGSIVPFAPIPVPEPNTRLIWVISNNRNWLTWVVSKTDSVTLSSDLYLDEITSGTPKLILHASSTKGVETVPTSVADDGSKVYYTRTTLDPKAYRIFSTVSDIFSLDVLTGKATALPANVSCQCAVTLTHDGRLMARLETNADRGAFDLRLYDLIGGTQTLFKAPTPATTQGQAGNMLFSRDGTLLAYVSAHGTPPTRFSPPEQYSLMLADIAHATQRTLDTGLSVELQPIAFSDDNTLLLAVGIDKTGTYKITLKDGTVLQTSAYTFLGTVAG